MAIQLQLLQLPLRCWLRFARPLAISTPSGEPPRRVQRDTIAIARKFLENPATSDLKINNKIPNLYEPTWPKEHQMTTAPEYQPPKVWTWEKPNGGTWGGTNRPTAGATHAQVLPRGKHPLQLYSLATPNGQKVTILLEELLALGVTGAEYDAHLIKIGDGDQFTSGFVDVNPNSKIPALFDHSAARPIRVFESGAILLYLADKFGHFLPKDHEGRTEALNWLFWLQGSAPYLGGGFGHFYAYAPIKFEYAINRFAMETKRQLDVLDQQLATRKFIAGDSYSIADIAIWPWYGGLVLHGQYNAAEFLDTASYKNVVRWATDISKRPAVARGRIVNRTWGPADEQLHERHDASDFQNQTEDKRTKA